jgi:hypothetical protein
MRGEQESFEGWAIVELMGHRRLAGRVSEEQIAGAAFLRLDIPDPDALDEIGDATQFYAPGAVYAITPTSEDTARAAAAAWRPEPVRRWELPALPQPDRLTEATDPIEWLEDPEYDRLRWAIARSRGHHGGSTEKDEQEAAAIIDALRRQRMPAPAVPLAGTNPVAEDDHGYDDEGDGDPLARLPF